MPKIDPIVLGTILIKYQQEIYELYEMTVNHEIAERLFLLHEKINKLLDQISSAI